MSAPTQEAARCLAVAIGGVVSISIDLGISVSINISRTAANTAAVTVGRPVAAVRIACGAAVFIDIYLVLWFAF